MFAAPGRRVRRSAAAAALGTLVVASCSVDSGVSTLTASETPEAVVQVPPPPTTEPSPDTTLPPDTTTVPTTEPADDADLPSIIEPQINAEIALDSVVEVDPGKPERPYDPFLAVAVTDVEQWWAREFPAVYGSDFTPLEGGIWAGYPERTTDLPGCGQPRTELDDLARFVAFYCQLGDFIVYDDANAEILAPLAEEYGPAVMGVVLAHEYGHAIQGRIGALDRALETIRTEQQADCFAGAWTGQAYRGESELLRLGDADVRAGLIAMLSVRDPVGTSQFQPGGHGSAFDRVGAFQEGFTQGPARCAELLDAPLDLVPNQFVPGTLDLILGGNAPYDCEELRDIGGTDEDVAACTPAPVFLADDLNHFWETTLGEFEPLQVQTALDVETIDCGEPAVLSTEVVYCPNSRTVVYDEPAILELYREFGDFALGYYYGVAWAEAAQRAIGSDLTGEQRALLSDCLTGAWVRDITPGSNGATPRQGDRDGDGIPDGISSSPGDLDEAIQIAILNGDDGANQNVVGTAFEKIEALRVGVLGGLGACQSDIGL